MKTAELTGALLDYWVAIAEGWTRVGRQSHIRPSHRESKDYPGTILSDWDGKGPHDFLVSPDNQTKIAYCGCESDGVIPQFSDDWEYGGPIIERQRIQNDGDLAAAMRAYVASKFGDEVPDTI